jgi:hypothetical protein
VRHVIVVVGSREQLQQAVPRIQPREGEAQRETTWYACRDQDDPGVLLDDLGSLLLKTLRTPFLAYNLYQQVHSTKLWSGKRPLVLVRGRSFASRLAAFAGRFGGGDIVMPSSAEAAPLGSARYLLLDDGNLELRT